ncbi:TBC1 domain family member 30 [Liparis tanakae]|uniref:TBC1 domain family member 30 n=1 Tax=Liparis tanakae TaxID=230148 RepID=A0A4Z2GBN3_9TELE|nr:TBC1 domain family member 30 [Liparis tanakae]
MTFDLLVEELFKEAPEELLSIVQEVRHRTGLQSTKLLRQLRRRDRLGHKLQKNYDVITACLQAVSQKRRKNSRSILLALALKRPAGGTTGR